MQRTFNPFIIFVACLFLYGNSAADDFEDVKIHGFISQGFLKTDSNNYLAETDEGTFQFNELGINFSSRISHKLRIGIQLFAKDLGTDGNDEIIVDWANADYWFREWFGIRIGMNKMPYGFYNKNRDIDMLRTWVLLPQGIYNELLRDLVGTFKGISLYGTFVHKKIGSISYEGQFGKANIDIGKGFEQAVEYWWRNLELDLTELKSYPSTTFSVLWRTPIEGLRTQYSYFYFPINYYGEFKSAVAKFQNVDYLELDGVLTGFVFSVEYMINKFSIVGEFTRAPFAADFDIGSGFEKVRTLPVEAFYISFIYSITDYFDAAITYSEYYPDRHNKNGKDLWEDQQYTRAFLLKGFPRNNPDFTAWLKTTTGSVSLDLNENWTAKIEVSYNDGFGNYTSAYNEEGSLKRYWFLYAAKLSFMF